MALKEHFQYTTYDNRQNLLLLAIKQGLKIILTILFLQTYQKIKQLCFYMASQSYSFLISSIHLSRAPRGHLWAFHLFLNLYIFLTCTTKLPYIYTDATWAKDPTNC